MSLRICTTISELRAARKALVGSVGFVPTMGALHEGHRSLIRAAKGACDAVVCSIFVNPAQFGPTEDLSKYPRTFEKDCAILEQEGVDILFFPAVDEMYPAGASTYVEPGEIGSRLDGASRPGHFRGVATVVVKLFHIVQPDTAFFGQKDAAQVAVLKTVVRDLDIPVTIEVCSTVREPDGLARSSRNAYLNECERKEALALSRTLRNVEKMFRAGITNRDVLRGALTKDLLKTASLRLDYAEIIHPDTLLPVGKAQEGDLVAVAAWIGSTRLIDNLVLTPEETAGGL